MRSAWMIPAVLVMTSSGVALAQGPAMPGGFGNNVDRSRPERFRPERGAVDRTVEKHNLMRAERFRARGDIEGGGASSGFSTRGSFQRVSPATKAAPIKGAVGQLRNKGEVEGVKGNQRVQAAGSQQTGEQRPAGSFKVSDKLASQANNRIRCAEGDTSCGAVARQAPIQAPRATGGSATLMKGAEPIANLRDRASKARESIMGKVSRSAMFCAIAQSEACNK